MMKALKRIRGAIGMGLTWALGWAVTGLVIGALSVLLPGRLWDAFFEVFDAPLPALAVPGFFAGVFFSTVLGIAARRHSFRELSLPRFATWGAAGGALLTLFPFALVAVGLASREGSTIGTAQILAAVGIPFVLLSAASATVTLLLARRAAERDSGGDAGGATLAESETHSLPGDDSLLRTRGAARAGEGVILDQASGRIDG
jgi:hypothetical protein